MTVQRRANAPRLITWTGERCVPWTPDVQVAYEHYHRYLWAADLVKGHRVLDLGSGEGYGSAILAGSAAFVCGIDVDPRTVEHSRLSYEAPNLEFRVASALDLSDFSPGEFSAVVAFEVIEHVSAQRKLLEQVTRVLSEDGLLIISTPDRRIYSDALGQRNQFHERELDEDEFRALLAERFHRVALWGQRTTTGSRIGALDGVGRDRPQTVFLERDGEEWQQRAEPEPLYLIALASNGEIDRPPIESTLADYGLELMRVQERARETEVEAARKDASDARKEANAERERRLQVEGSVEAELRQFAARVDEAHAYAETRDAELADLYTRLARIEGSVVWSMFQRARGRLYQTVGDDSATGHIIQASLRALGRRTLARPAPTRRIAFPRFEDPVASLVIPVHSQAELTASCLRSILINTHGVTYEVILVDDTADEATKQLLHSVENARVLINEQNLGFLRSMNRGCSVARGSYVVLFNNDTEVQPGWLRRMVDRARSAPDIGVVGPMLLYPDGTLQEAGGIVFQDGTAWNFGRGDDPDRPSYNYVRDIDYASAACLLVRADVFRALGGFDDQFAPIYWEDTDLCFATREHGYRVVYEPAARVIHVEGATSGTDTSTGSKSHQTLNQPKFIDKWRSRLEHEQMPPSPSNVRRASDRNGGPEVLVIADSVHTPAQPGRGRRTLQLLQTLRELGCRVGFLPEEGGHEQPYTDQLQSLGVQVLYSPIDGAAEIEAMGSCLRLGIVVGPPVAARYLPLLREHAPRALVAYDLPDLRYLREVTGEDFGHAAERHQRASLREIELALVRGCDLAIVTSESDHDYLAGELATVDVEVVPNAIETLGAVSGPETRSDLLFIGNFDHSSDIDSVTYLVRTVMPYIWRELGDVTLTVSGPSPSPEIEALSAPGVEVLAYGEELRLLLNRFRVVVAPYLRRYEGAINPLAYGLAAGLPVVTTPMGAAGVNAVAGQDVLVAQDPETFAALVARVYGDAAVWRELSEAGQRLTQRAWSPTAMSAGIQRLINASLRHPHAATEPDRSAAIGG